MTRDRACRWFATGSYIGYLPLVPGTYASAAACVLVYFVPLVSNPAVLVLLTAAAIFSAERARGEAEDPRCIVIDEIIGMLVCMAGHEPTVWNLIKGFILFRAFDILKPYPIKKLERLPGAYGIIADDILAGLFGNGVLFLWGRLM